MKRKMISIYLFLCWWLIYFCSKIKEKIVYKYELLKEILIELLFHTPDAFCSDNKNDHYIQHSFYPFNQRYFFAIDLNENQIKQKSHKKNSSLYWAISCCCVYLPKSVHSIHKLDLVNLVT